MDSSQSEAGVKDRVSIIVVNWNAGVLLKECLESVIDFGFRCGSVLEAIVVDNGSFDDSICLIQGLAQTWPVRIICNPENRGFAAACNQGAALARGSLLLFLNPDCRIAAGAVEACAACLEKNPAVGVASVALEDAAGNVSRSCDYFPTLTSLLFKISGLSAAFKRLPDGSMRCWSHATDRIVDHVIGAFYMVRAAEFRELGGFDELFFVYYEDLDLSLRYRHAGKSCMFLAAPRAYHKGGGSSSKAKASRLFFVSRSRVLYTFKHFSAYQAWLHLCVTLLIEPIARTVFLAISRRINEVPDVLRAFVQLHRDLPAILRLAYRK